MLGAVDDEHLLVGDDVAALVGRGDDHDVLALGQVGGLELRLRGRAGEVALLVVEDELDRGHAELVRGLDAHGDAGLLHGLVERGDLEHRRLGVDEHVEVLGRRVPRPVGGRDRDVRCAVGQLGADRVLAGGVGRAARLDRAVDHSDGRVGLRVAAERGRIGVDAALVGGAVELELGDARVDGEAPVLADLVTEEVGALRAEGDRVLAVGETARGEGEGVAVRFRVGRDVVAVERDGDGLQLGQAPDVEDEGGGRALDERVRPRRHRGDAGHAVELPADHGREHANRRYDDVRPAAAAALFSSIDVVRGVRHRPLLGRICSALYRRNRHCPRFPPVTPWNTRPDASGGGR